MLKHQKRQIEKTEEFVKNFFKTEGSGHDWWHIERVRNMALKIAKIEGGELFLIEMSALLHDVDDWKLTANVKPSGTKSWFNQLNISATEANQIEEITNEVSFKGAGVETKPTTIEAKIVQDADRLDAIGAIGIARAFAYGGNKNRLIYDPNKTPELHNSFDEYKKGKGSTINHFYEKLLLLKDRLNTQTAKKIATNRHEYMEHFLEQFFDEWYNKK